MKKVILLIIIFLLIILSSVSAKAEYIDVEIRVVDLTDVRVVDLTDEPVSGAWVRIWNETGGEIVSCCGITGGDGIENLRIPGKEGPYVIQVFSFAGVDKPHSRGRELARESRYIFNSTTGSDAFYTIVVDEVNGSKGNTKTYEMAKNSLDISTDSLRLSKWAFIFAAISLIFTVLKWPKRKIWGDAENMLSKKADEIVKAVKETHTDDKIEDLLKNHDKPEKEFIQKYAETEIAVRSLKVTSVAYFVALILFVFAILVSILINKYPDHFENYFMFTIVGYIIILICLICYVIKIVFEREPLQKIIIAIEDDIKLKAHEQIESLILLNINEISNEVNSINSRIDILEKTVIEKADVTLKENMNLKHNEMPACQGDKLDD